MRPIELGNIRVHKIPEMECPVPLLSQLTATTPDDLAQLRTWYEQPDEITADPATSLMTISMHSWVIEVDGLRILVDTCCGNGKHRMVPEVNNLDTEYLLNLKRAGFTPDDIDLVMCTHLHFDHIGWNTKLENGKWVPTFPNARYLFSRRDYEFFKNLPDNLPGEEPHREAFLDSVVPVMEAGKGEIVEGDAVVHREIGDGVWLEPAYGHSPGCCTIGAQRGGAPGLFWGDVIHHPVQLVRNEMPYAFDSDQIAAASNRKNLLERVADSDTVCFPAHFRRSSAGMVKRDGSAFRFEFLSSD